jgi:uncharacterized protein (TIGR01244 family)
MLFTQFKKILVAISISTLLFSLASDSAAKDGVTEFQMKNTAMPYENLITGGQPTKADLVKMAKQGVSLVINLRTQGEFDGYDEKKLVNDLGMKYLVIPVNGARGINNTNAELLHRALSQSKGTVLLHCASSNRVGGLLGLKASLFEKASNEEAILLGKKAGMRSTKEKLLKLLGQ